jgi:hypothetical protein
VSDLGGAPGWSEYKLLVLDHIERLSTQVRSLEGKMDAFRADDISNLKVEIALLKLKAGVWGAVSGAVPAAIGTLIWWMSK